ncbi:hypothetical protein SCA6_019532, partial [Theobroma cacao]
ILGSYLTLPGKPAFYPCHYNGIKASNGGFAALIICFSLSLGIRVSAQTCHYIDEITMSMLIAQKYALMTDMSPMPSVSLTIRDRSTVAVSLSLERA